MSTVLVDRVQVALIAVWSHTAVTEADLELVEMGLPVLENLSAMVEKVSEDRGTCTLKAEMPPLGEGVDLEVLRGHCTMNRSVTVAAVVNLLVVGADMVTVSRASLAVVLLRKATVIPHGRLLDLETPVKVKVCSL